MAALLAGTTLHKSLSTESLSSSSSNDTDVAPPKKYTTQKVDRRPASTFHLKAWKDQTWSERLADKGTMAPEYHELQTETMDRGALPKHSVLYEHAWILSNALPPILLQSLSYYLFPEYKWPVALAFVVYLVSLRILLVRIVQHFGHYALKYGTYDEKVVGRDRTPDHSVGQLAFGFLFFILARLSGEFALAYDKDVSPLSAFKWHYPARAFLWIVVMDLCCSFFVFLRLIDLPDASESYSLLLSLQSIRIIELVMRSMRSGSFTKNITLRATLAQSCPSSQTDTRSASRSHSFLSSRPSPCR